MIKVMIKDFDHNVYHLELTDEQYTMAQWFFDHDFILDLEQIEFESVK